MSLGHLIRKRREQLNLTLDEVAAATGFSKPYLSTVETGKVKNPPSDRLLSRLEEVLQFDSGVLQHTAHIERIPADIRREYDTLDAQNRHYRKILNDIIEHTLEPSRLGEVLAEYELDVGAGSQGKRDGRWVPVINKVAAGYPAQFSDLGYPAGFADDYVRCPDIHDPNAFAVRVVGDSMEPKFRQGDIVVFSPAAEVHNGDDCFVRFSMPHETTFKRVFFESDERIRLQPRNTDYPPSFVEGRRVNGMYRAAIHFQTL